MIWRYDILINMTVDLAKHSTKHKKIIPPAQEDEEWAGGSASDVASDDDVDAMGKAVGVSYGDTEELNIADKLKNPPSDALEED